MGMMSCCHGDKIDMPNVLYMCSLRLRLHIGLSPSGLILQGSGLFVKVLCVCVWCVWCMHVCVQGPKGHRWMRVSGMKRQPHVRQLGELHTALA